MIKIPNEGMPVGTATCHSLLMQGLGFCNETYLTAT
jgi:hypothetical protein